MRKLFIGNKNYSSWSMRAWVLMRQSGIEFEEVMLRFDGFSADSQFKKRLAEVSPAGQVPVLIDADLAIWDTLAIAEYLAEKFPERQLWPSLVAARARARSGWRGGRPAPPRRGRSPPGARRGTGFPA